MEKPTSIRTFFDSGETRSYQYRRKQLEALMQCVYDYEHKISAALYADLGKNKEEAWFTEIGLLLEEIKYTLRHLNKWMKPKRVWAGLTTFPSTAKIHQEPRGVVLIIAPWNYPFQLSLVPLVGAIAAGCCAVIKPSEMAPETAKVVTQMITEIFPANYVRVVNGEGAEVVPQWIEQLHFDHIFYTGSIATGKKIYQMAAEKLIPVTLELGGKSPCIVYDDADIKVAVKRIVWGKFINAGQTCIAPDYILVHESIRAEFMKEMVKVIKDFYTNSPEKSYDYGKIINQKRFRTLQNFIKEGTVFYGGHLDEDSLFIGPTILYPVTINDKIMKEEIFGPLLPILTFNTDEQAIHTVLQNKNPLAFYLFTRSKKIEKLWLNRISFGGGCINNTVVHFANLKMPFGGIGNSGMGAYHGENTFRIFSHQKPVLKTATFVDPSIKYPTYKGKLKWFKRLLG